VCFVSCCSSVNFFSIISGAFISVLVSVLIGCSIIMFCTCKNDYMNIFNKSHIVTIWRGEAVRAMDEEGTVTETKEVTFVFVPPHGTWEVEETHEDIVKLLKD
jgi:hypothetical protein